MAFDTTINKDQPEFPEWVIRGMMGNTLLKLCDTLFYELSDMAYEAIRYQAYSLEKEARQVNGFFAALKINAKWNMNHEQCHRWYQFCQKTLQTLEREIRFYIKTLTNLHSRAQQSFTNSMRFP